MYFRWSYWWHVNTGSINGLAPETPMTKSIDRNESVQSMSYQCRYQYVCNLGCSLERDYGIMNPIALL